MTEHRIVSYLLLVTLIIVAVACSSMKAAAPPRQFPVPAGWKTYTYGRAEISAPATWAVVTDYICPGSRPQGALYLGPSRGDPSCPYPGQGDSVTIESIGLGVHFQGDTCRAPAKVNDLTVYLPHCASSEASGSISWAIPSLDILAVGIVASTGVTDGSPRTTVGKVLHTIRRR